MMKYNILKISYLAFAFGLFSCVNDSDYVLPNFSNETQMPPFYGNLVSFEKVISAASTTITNYQGDDAIEGYVISSDEAGNFYKKIYIQNEEKTAGISLSINKIGLYTEFPFGAKVQVRLKGLSMQINNGGLELGYQEYTSASGKKSVGAMPEAFYTERIYEIADDIAELSELTKADQSANVLKISANVNQLITLKNVSFEEKSIGQNFHLKENDAYQGTTINLIDNQGVKIPFRTSRYAQFAKEKVPSGRFEITGVLTKFGTSYQFMISNLLSMSKLSSESNISQETILEADTATASDYKSGKKVKLSGKIVIFQKKSYIKFSDDTMIQIYATAANLKKLSQPTKDKLNADNQQVTINGKFTDYKPKNGNLVRRIVFTKETELEF